MPIMKCQKDGKSGYKWGEGGNCIIGENAKKIVIKQGLAINYKKYGKNGGKMFQKEMSKAATTDEEITRSDIEQLLSSEYITMSPDEVNQLADILNLSLAQRDQLFLSRSIAQKQSKLEKKE
jgi:hypothetical protein